MDKDRIKGGARQVRGSVNEAIGKVTGNERIEAQGAAEKDAGKNPGWSWQAEGRCPRYFQELEVEGSWLGHAPRAMPGPRSIGRWRHANVPICNGSCRVTCDLSRVGRKTRAPSCSNEFRSFQPARGPRRRPCQSSVGLS
jgi:hypothetical protein